MPKRARVVPGEVLEDELSDLPIRPRSEKRPLIHRVIGKPGEKN